jgi:hypothetical protein
MASNIRRLIGSEANRSHLRALPNFQVEKALPPNLSDLLKQLERAEQERPERRH